MGLFDKIKDLFMDEIVEDEEIELEEENKDIYEEPKNVLPKVMRDTIKREEKREEVKRPVLEVKEEKKEVVEPAKKFTFPIDFSYTPVCFGAINRTDSNYPKGTVSIYKLTPSGGSLEVIINNAYSTKTSYGVFAIGY